MKNQITVVDISLQQINKDLAVFDAGGIVSGVVHIPDHDKATVLLDGGHVLGAFHCPACAIKTIGELAANLDSAEKRCGMSYSEHKRQFMN